MLKIWNSLGAGKATEIEFGRGLKMSSQKQRQWSFLVLGVLQGLIGVGAVSGGLLFIIDPTGKMLGIPPELLQGSPFPDYFIPGLFLFLVNGLGSLLGGSLTLLRYRHAGELAIALGIILMAWIVIQVLIINHVHWLHYLYFALGLLELVLGFGVRRDLQSNNVKGSVNRTQPPLTP